MKRLLCHVCLCGILVAVAMATAPKPSLNTLLGGWLGLFVGATVCERVICVAQNPESLPLPTVSTHLALESNSRKQRPTKG